MSVSQVSVSADAYFVCLSHALSTEKEEIMGLLIGEIDEQRTCHISAVIMLTRSDKQPDRVEISPEQLSAASTEAERLADELKQPMRVIGWYHSHPHITVWPSHVDVRTQADYQMLDDGFVGLIYSVFNQDKNTKHNRVEVTCFQSTNISPEGEMPQYSRLEVPLHIVPVPCIREPNMRCLMELPFIIAAEESEQYNKCTKDPHMDMISRIHNTAVYSKSTCHIIDVMCGPLIQMLESRLKNNKALIVQLTAEKQRLKILLEKSPGQTTSV